MENKAVEILWTGGWDSTYRMVELSRKEGTVKPVYVYGDNRPSELYERKAMNDILDALRKHKETKATFLPIEFIDKKQIPENEKVTNAYKIIHESTGLGPQHEYLGRLAFQRPGIELGHEHGVSAEGHLTKALNQFCCVYPNPAGEGYYFDKDKSTKEGTLVLGNFAYSIMDKTEEDMARNIKEWGYEDVMKLIWFCHNPIKGKPCGVCHPCKVKVGSGMAYLLPEVALKRRKKYDALKPLLGEKVARHLARLL